MLLNNFPVLSSTHKRMKKIRGFMRKVSSACNASYDLMNCDWYNFSHIHLDWKGYGDYSRKARSLFIKRYAELFISFEKMFNEQNHEFQMFIATFPYDSSSDCIYFHTSNPHSEFPVKLIDVKWNLIDNPNIFTDLMPQHKIFEGVSTSGIAYYHYAEGVGVSLK